MRSARIAVVVPLLALGLGCSGLSWPAWPWSEGPERPTPPVVIVIPAPVDPGGAQLYDPLTPEPEPEPEPEPRSRLEIFWGPPEQGDAVWAEGERMEYDPSVGPHGTWFRLVDAGRYEIVIRDGISGTKKAIQNDLVVGEDELLWCEPLPFDPEVDEEYLLLEEDCRRGRWPGDIRRDPL